MEQVIVSDEQSRLDRTISENLQAADNFINRNYLINAVNLQVMDLEGSPDWTSIRLFKVKKIVYDKKENVNDKLISVYAALQNIHGSVLLVIDAKADGVHLYIGVRESANSVTDIATSAEVLKSSFLGNFPGSELDKLRTSEVTEILTKAVSPSEEEEAKTVSGVTIIPSMRDKEKDKFVQGLEKFIDTMRSVDKEYTAILIASSVPKAVLELQKRGLEKLSSSLSPMAKTTLAYGENSSKAVSEGTSENFSESINENISTTNGTNLGYNSSESWGSSSGSSFNMEGMGVNSGTNKSKSQGYSSGQSWSRSVSKGTSTSTSTGTNQSETITDGTSLNTTVEYQNKSVAAIMEKIDAKLKRIRGCETFGLWEFAAYFIAEDVATSVVAANTYKALMSGEESDVENSFINVWSGTRDARQCELVLQYLERGRHPLLRVEETGSTKAQIVMPSTMISGKELPILMGMPQKSVSGVSVSSIAEFGRNVVVQNRRKTGEIIELGCVHHMGADEPGAKVNLDMDSFTSHCFVTGSTGSGKSNTTYGLLYSFHDKNIPFLVIEPAKGEYKEEFCNLPDINIFTTNPRLGEMLKLNPFSFHYKEIHVLEHLDRLVEIFNACWEMYAAMPAILKDAVERIYIEKGWDLLNSVFIGGDNPVFPTFQDLMAMLPRVIDSSGYSADAKGDYTGALVTRVRSLTNGISGQIFCDCYDIADEILFDQNTIVDLSRVGSSETKSLIMGILVLKLTEYRMAERKESNAGLKHITVMEEAHNLLKNAAAGEGSNVIKKSVEMICNNIAEMRTYGEGFIIVDQSPSAVDIAAIKNTNTKIVMRLPEKNDREAVGNSIGLNEEQIKELSKLSMGKAAVMQNNWLEAVLTGINKAPGEFKAEVKSIQYETLKRIRGLALNCLMCADAYYGASEDEKAEAERRLEEAKSKIEQISDAPHKKREIQRFIESICNRMSVIESQTQRHVFMVTALLNVSGTRSVFDLLDQQKEEARRSYDESEEDGELFFEEDKLKAWFEAIVKQMPDYFSESQFALEKIVRCLILAKKQEDETYKAVVDDLNIR